MFNKKGVAFPKVNPFRRILYLGKFLPQPQNNGIEGVGYNPIFLLSLNYNNWLICHEKVEFEIDVDYHLNTHYNNLISI